jgi:hypothetical protein
VSVKEDEAPQRVGSVVTYDGLPLSSGSAHGLGCMTGRAAYKSALHFLDTCCVVDGDVEHWFSLSNPPELEVSPAVADELRSRFPPKAHRFVVPADRVDEAFGFLDRISPQPTNPWGMAPVWFWVTARMRLRIPGGLDPWPGQDREMFGGFETASGIRLGESRLQLVVERRSSISLAISIPNASDADLSTMIPWLQEDLPFRMSRKHWIRWTITKRGNAYRGKRIDPPWTD